MTKKSLLLVISALLASNLAFADTAGDTQTVSVTVPSIKLLDIKAASGTSTSADEADALSFTLTAPTAAGDNFANATTGGFYDVTSNVASGGSTTRKITVAADTLGAGWKLTLTPTAVSGATANTISFTSSDVASKDLVTAVGNIAAKDTAISYTFGPESASIVPSYTGADGTTAENITLTYTLSDDS